MKKFSRILFAASLFLVLLISVSFAADGRVLRVVDGDTIVVKLGDAVEKVRLLCVNTPESVHPDKKQNIPMGKVASDFAKKRLSGRNVTLEFEEGNRRGNYGRLLAYVYIDGENFNIELVRQGLSPYYTKYGFSKNHHQAFKAAEKTARKEKFHIWGDPELTEKYLRLKSKWGQKRSSRKDPESKKGVEPFYLASEKSKVFHRPGCPCAEKISPRNLVVFNSLSAAAANRKPCHICRP